MRHKIIFMRNKIKFEMKKILITRNKITFKGDIFHDINILKV